MTEAFPPSREYLEGSLSKCAILKVELLQDRQMHCWQAPEVHISAPEFYKLGQWRG